MQGSIPKTIIQTGPWNTYDTELRNKIIAMNPGYTYRYFNNNDCIKFIRDNFDHKVVDAFNGLKSGAFKADLFRYCYLYVEGGIYIDIDLEPHVPFDDVIPPDADFVSCRENVAVYPQLRGIWQAFMAGKKNLVFLQDAIVRIVTNVYNKTYPNAHDEMWNNILSITGPRLLYDVMHIEGVPKLGYSNARDSTIYLYYYGPYEWNPEYDVYNIEGKKIFSDLPSIDDKYKHMFKNKDIYH